MIEIAKCYEIEWASTTGQNTRYYSKWGIHIYTCGSVQQGNTGYYIQPRVGGLPVSHLQFANNNLLFYPPDLSHLKTIKSILRCIKAISGLRINFGKSSIISCRVDQELIRQYAKVVKYKVGSLPFIF